MDFELTKVQKMIRDLARQFAQKEVAPIAARIDESGEFPMDTVKKLGKMGFFGIEIPRDYGGAGLDSLSYVLVIEELSKVCGSHGAILSGLNSLVCWGFYKFGNEDQRRKYLVPVAKGDWLGAFSLTEPSAGSDAANMRTTALLDPASNEYVINGTKSWVSTGMEADVITLFALTDPSKGHKGISAFIVEPKRPGLTVGKVEPKLGIRGSHTVEMHYENYRLPAENRLGAEGEGMKVALGILDSGRIGIAAQALGIAEGAFEASVAYARERDAFGQKIADFQGIQWMLADMHARIEAARLLIYHAAFLKDKGQKYTKESATAKLYASETAMWVTTKAVQIHGGVGYSKEFPIERMFRDAKITEIYEGTSEIQRLIIAREILR